MSKTNKFNKIDEYYNDLEKWRKQFCFKGEKHENKE